MAITPVSCIERGDIGDDEMAVHECVCGARFVPWEFYLTTNQDDPKACPQCGRRFFFQVWVKVFEVTND